MSIETIFLSKLPVINGVYITSDNSELENQPQINEIYSDKWIKYSREKLQEQEKLFQFQKACCLDSYTFSNEGELKSFLEDKEMLIGAGLSIDFIHSKEACHGGRFKKKN